MKRSFYEMLEVPRTATLEQIDAALEAITRKFDATTSVRGAAATMNELNMLREGHAILSNPEKRAVYDAKLYATEKGIKLIFFPKDTKAARKLGVDTMIFAALACVFTFMLYQKLTRETSVAAIDQAVQSAPANLPASVVESGKTDTQNAQAVKTDAASVGTPAAAAAQKSADSVRSAPDTKAATK